MATATVLAAIVFSLGLNTAPASADGATVTWLSQTSPNFYSLALTVERDACPPSAVSTDCRWFPATTWVRAGQPCPASAEDGTFIWVGWINDGAGSELGGGEFNVPTAFNLCTYAFYLSSYHLIHEADNAQLAAIPTNRAKNAAADAMTSRQATRYTRTYLRHKYGRRYDAHDVVKSTCDREDHAAFICTVAWQKQGKYSGRVWHRAYVDGEGDRKIVSRSNIRLRD
ncbi:MAG: hypothetical protein ACRDKI_09885 [Solirubrobacterales bacterium]